MNGQEAAPETLIDASELEGSSVGGSGMGGMGMPSMGGMMGLFGFGG